MLDVLLSRFFAHDRQALSRLLTLVARGEQLEAIRAAVDSQPRHARVVAVTGNTGVGKSTLVGKLLEQARGAGQTVAVLACDPQSPLTGGALLGDRLRMPSLPDDAGVFIRSVAAPGGHQAVAEHVDLMLHLLSAFGFQVVLLETVGAGQGDTAVADLANVVVLVVQPESGDEFQWEKAGVWEVADVVAIHKADLPGAERLEAQVRDLLSIPGSRVVPVARVSSLKNEGLAELWTAILACPPRPAPIRHDAHHLLRLCHQELAARFHQRPETISPILKRWLAQEIDESQAAVEVLKKLAE